MISNMCLCPLGGYILHPNEVQQVAWLCSVRSRDFDRFVLVGLYIFPKLQEFWHSLFPSPRKMCTWCLCLHVFDAWVRNVARKLRFVFWARPSCGEALLQKHAETLSLWHGAEEK